MTSLLTATLGKSVRNRGAALLGRRYIRSSTRAAANILATDNIDDVSITAVTVNELFVYDGILTLPTRFSLVLPLILDGL